MATTTLQTARREIGKYTTPWFRVRATTTNISGSATVIDTSLEGEGYHEDDALNGFWFYLNSTNNAGVERLVEDHAGSAGSLTIRGATLVAETDSRDFELHRFSPTDVMDALNWSMNSEYQYIWKEVSDETLTTHANQTSFSVPSSIHDVDEIYLERPLGVDFDENILKDYGDFEGWDVSTYPNGSDAATNLTLSKASESDNVPVKYGDYGCKVVVAATTAGTHYWTDQTTPANFSDVKTTYSEWIYASVADKIRIAIKDGTDSTYSDYHAGGGWERLAVTKTTESPCTALQAGIDVASTAAAATFWRDNAIWTRTDRKCEHRWEKLYNWRVDNSVIRFPYNLPEDRALRLVGRIPLTALSSDTGTTEVGEPEIQILYASAILYLYRQERARHTGKDRNQFDDDVMFWEGELEKMRRMNRMSKRMASGVDSYWR